MQVRGEWAAMRIEHRQSVLEVSPYRDGGATLSIDEGTQYADITLTSEECAALAVELIRRREKYRGGNPGPRENGFYWIRWWTYLGKGQPGADEDGCGWRAPEVARWSDEDGSYSRQSWDIAGSEEGVDEQHVRVEVLSPRLECPNLTVTAKSTCEHGVDRSLVDQHGTPLCDRCLPLGPVVVPGVSDAELAAMSAEEKDRAMAKWLFTEEGLERGGQQDEAKRAQHAATGVLPLTHETGGSGGDLDGGFIERAHNLAKAQIQGARYGNEKSTTVYHCPHCGEEMVCSPEIEALDQALSEAVGIINRLRGWGPPMTPDEIDAWRSSPAVRGSRRRTMHRALEVMADKQRENL